MRKRLGFFARLAFIVVFVFLAVSIIDKNIELNKLQKREEEAKQRVQELTVQVEKLNSKMNEPVTKETIMRIAKEKLNLREPDEVIYASDLPN